MKLIEFSIAEFEKRGGIGKCRVVTRSGVGVRILATDLVQGQPIVGFSIERGLDRWSRDGRYVGLDNCDTRDLLIVDESVAKFRPWTRSELVAKLIKDGPFAVHPMDKPGDVFYITSCYTDTQTLFSGYILVKYSPEAGAVCGVEE
jgi:hypothetical protein